MSLEEFNRRNQKGARRPEQPGLGLELTPRPERVQGGRDAQSGGKAFESCLQTVHDIYRINARAWIYRLPVNTQPMPRAWLKDPTKGGIGRILAERQQADYFGYLAGGRAVVMEAKSTIERAASLPIIAPGKTGSGLKAHQLAGLVEAHKAGAAAMVVWRNGPEGLVLPGATLVDIWAEFRLGRLKRIPAAKGVPYQTQRPGGILVHDYLTAFESAR